jgi:hypothetical protein
VSPADKGILKAKYGLTLFIISWIFVKISDIFGEDSRSLAVRIKSTIIIPFIPLFFFLDFLLPETTLSRQHSVHSGDWSLGLFQESPASCRSTPRISRNSLVAPEELLPDVASEKKGRLGETAKLISILDPLRTAATSLITRLLPRYRELNQKADPGERTERRPSNSKMI